VSVAGYAEGEFFFDFAANPAFDAGAGGTGNWHKTRPHNAFARGEASGGSHAPVISSGDFASQPGR
jgi:hypothetical protein